MIRAHVFRQGREVTDIEIETLSEVRTEKGTLWRWWAGPGQPDLDLAWRAYIRRFDLEHTLPFASRRWGGPAPGRASPPGRPVDLAGAGRLHHPAAARQRDRGRPAAAMGAAPAYPFAVALAGAAGVFAPCVRAGVPGRCAKTLWAFPRTAQGPMPLR